MVERNGGLLPSVVTLVDKSEGGEKRELVADNDSGV
jgi:hypothetical protein